MELVGEDGVGTKIREDTQKRQGTRVTAGSFKSDFMCVCLINELNSSFTSTSVSLLPVRELGQESPIRYLFLLPGSASA